MKAAKLMILKILSVLLILLIIVIISDQLVTKLYKGKVYNKIENIPYNRVGLVLGTIKYLENGRVNLYYLYRIDSAEKLFKAGKVKYLIVSGDNSRYGYNEPKDMKDDLVKRGIPAKYIYEDFAGFRTLDSVVRAKEVFNQNSITIISQKFHNERAIFIAKRKNINAIGFNAKDINGTKALKVKLREYLARVKVILDLYILNTKPKFFGDKIEII